MAQKQCFNLNPPAHFENSSTVQLLPPSCFEASGGGVDHLKDFTQTVSELLTALDEFKQLKLNQIGRKTGSVGASHPQQVAVPAADSSHDVLQHLVSAVEMLHSKLQQSGQPVTLATSSELLEMQAQIYKMKEQYEAEIKDLQQEKSILQTTNEKAIAEWERMWQEREADMKVKVTEFENKMADIEHSAAEKINSIQKMSCEEKQELNEKIRDSAEQIEQLKCELSRLKTYTTQSDSQLLSADVCRKEIVSLKNQLQVLDKEKNNLVRVNNLLSTRMNVLADILATQEQYITPGMHDTATVRKCLLTRWREKVYELLVQLKANEACRVEKDHKWACKVAESERQRLEAEKKCDMLTLTLQDKQAALEVHKSQSDSLAEELHETRQQLIEQRRLHEESSASLASLSELVHKSLGTFSQSLETFTKQIYTKVHSQYNRITFATGRMELLKAQLARQKALLVAELSERKMSEAAPSSPGDSHCQVEELTMELQRVVAERDTVAMQLKTDAECLNDKIMAATKQATDEALDLRHRLTELHDTLDKKSQECEALRQRLVDISSELSQSHSDIEILKTELAKAQLNTHTVSEQLKASLEDEYRQQIAALEQSLNESRRQYTKTVISLRQLERQLDREKERMKSELENLTAEHEQEVLGLKNQLHVLQTDNNLLMTTLRQEGLIGRHKIASGALKSDTTVNSRDQTLPQTQAAAIDDVISDLKLLSAEVLDQDDDET